MQRENEQNSQKGLKIMLLLKLRCMGMAHHGTRKWKVQAIRKYSMLMSGDFIFKQQGVKLCKHRNNSNGSAFREL